MTFQRDALFAYSSASESALVNLQKSNNFKKMFWRDRFLKINQLIDYEKREKERIIAKRKQEYVFDLKKNFDDQVKIFNESLNSDRNGSK